MAACCTEMEFRQDLCSTFHKTYQRCNISDLTTGLPAAQGKMQPWLQHPILLGCAEAVMIRLHLVLKALAGLCLSTMRGTKFRGSV